jgi:predicted nucleic acid-binding protein
LGRALALDKGEIEALSLMDLHPKAVLLTDDSAARLAAEHRRIRAHGTIGILIRSVRKGHRTEREALDLLRGLPSKSTLYIRSTHLAEIIKTLEEEWNVTSEKDNF